MPTTIAKMQVRNTILRRVQLSHLVPRVVSFRTVLAEGANILVDVGCGSFSAERLIGAHYDGASVHDNLGSVLALVEAAICASQHRVSYRAAFWDCEETFQQGSRAYVRTHEAPTEYVNLDGIGIGPRLVVSPTDAATVGDSFLMDSDSFAGICKSYHVWSADDALIRVFQAGGLPAVQCELDDRPTLPLEDWRRNVHTCANRLKRLICGWQQEPFEAVCRAEGVWIEMA